MSSPLPQFSARHPPCRVCQDKASGLHYGVNTCSACKGFFNRCLKIKHVKPCRLSGTCEIRPRQRNCAACRYAKCLSMGMSMDAIKIGRCSYEVKTKAIHEVKQLEAQHRIKQDGTSVPSEQHTAEMDKIIQQLTEIHLVNAKARSEENTMAELADKENMFLEKLSLDAQLFGSLNTLSKSEYKAVFQETQLDVDGRREKFRRMASAMEQHHRLFMSMAHHVPGFTLLCKEDQLSLYRESFLCSWLFQYYYMYNTEKGIYINPYDTQLYATVEEMISYHGDEEFPRQMFSLAGRIQQLELTLEESIAAAAMSLMTTGCGLTCEGYKIAAASAECLMESLLRMIELNHDPSDRIVSRVVQIICDSVTFADITRRFFLDFIIEGQELGIENHFGGLFID